MFKNHRFIYGIGGAEGAEAYKKAMAEHQSNEDDRPEEMKASDVQSLKDQLQARQEEILKGFEGNPEDQQTYADLEAAEAETLAGLEGKGDLAADYKESKMSPEEVARLGKQLDEVQARILAGLEGNNSEQANN